MIPMEYHNYFIVFPEGDIQEIKHPLEIGMFVDMNGMIFEKERKLNPRVLAYRVSAYSKKIVFKEIEHYYRLEQLNADEVTDEIVHRTLEEKKYKEKLDKVYAGLEKKVLNKKWRLWK